MIYRFLLVVLLALCLAGCKTAEVYHFIHDETEADRRSLQWSLPNPELTSENINTGQPYLVVDFYRFWPGYSASAYVYIVQNSGAPVELKSISVTSSQTGESLYLQLNLDASPKTLEGGYYLYRYRVIDAATSNKFSEADSLKVSIKWSEKVGKEKISTFELKKKVKSEVVWPT
ncbi:hypothetical protein L4174_009725 [Photobacterium sp. CCB-ST2H9]|uniref:hypothetical protein n=1 Tax=Photobacterium sp. CCB-ST2H9 TaxID=2912855 RepID=UPI0020047D21|nr:hypothetical protein [Photobacterium sp. CCB-ST2H9]UTM56127.1 hypothetical protein L4174_009725 [Photobacterium sp. CCB-ST2H9]